MKKYHVAAGDGRGYYGVGYESYRQAESLLKISQEHDPQAHIVEEEYHFTNADRIRAMSDEELEPLIFAVKLGYAPWCDHHCENEGDDGCDTCVLKWLKQPVDGVLDG